MLLRTIVVEPAKANKTRVNNNLKIDFYFLLALESFTYLQIFPKRLQLKLNSGGR